MHLQPLFLDALNVTNGTSQFLFANGLTLPSGSSLSEGQIKKISESISTFVSSGK
jgi:hypothetical protein